MNSNTRTASYYLLVGGISVLLSLFYFSYNQSNAAYTVAQENRERIAVMEAQFKEWSGMIKYRLDDLRVDIKDMKQLLKERK